MNPNRFRRLVFTATAMFAICASLAWLWRRDNTLRAFEAEIEARLVTIRRLQRTMKSQQTQTQAPLANPTASAGAPVAASRRSRGVSKDGWIVDTMQRLPEYAPFARMQYQRFAMREFGDWFRQLNVSPERLALIKQAMADAIEKRTREYDALLASGADANSAAYRDGDKRIDEQMDAALKAVLTSDEYGSLSQFKRAQTWNNCLPEMDAFFEDRGVPALTPEQRRAFLAASIEGSRYRPEGPAPARGALFRMRNERIAALATTSLQAAQREALLDYMAFYNQRSKLAGELLNPSDPEAMEYSGGKAF
jgi:hypothetical protein